MAHRHFKMLQGWAIAILESLFSGMNTHMNKNKLFLALLGLCIAGAAHASRYNPKYTPDASINIAGTNSSNPDSITTQSGGTSSYELVIPVDPTQVSFDLGTSLSRGQSVTYTIYQDTDSTIDQVQQGRKVTSFSLNGNDTSNTLTLTSGLQYLLEITLNGFGNVFGYGFNVDCGGGKGGSVITLISDPVSPVPLPGTALLFGSGLIGLIGFSRKRARKAA